MAERLWRMPGLKCGDLCRLQSPDSPAGRKKHPLNHAIGAQGGDFRGVVAEPAQQALRIRAQVRRRAGGRRLGRADRRRDQPVGAVGRVPDGLEPAVLDHEGIVERPGDIVHRRGRDDAGETGQPVGGGAGLQRLVQNFGYERPVLQPVLETKEARVLRPLRAAPTAPHRVGQNFSLLHIRYIQPSAVL